MGKSFFIGTDAEIYTGSAAFSTQIGATPTSFGISAIQAASYATLNTSYASAYLAATNPDTRTKATVAAKNSARQNLKISASSLAKIIDGTPFVTDAQKAALGLSVRGTPGPMPPPGTPSNFVIELIQGGALRLLWKCANPKGSVGTIYQIYRRISTAVNYDFLTSTGDKKFTDETIPPGSASVTYKIVAVRSTASGDPAEFTVGFGIGGGGEITAAVMESAPKLAA